MLPHFMHFQRPSFSSHLTLVMVFFLLFKGYPIASAEEEMSDPQLSPPDQAQPSRSLDLHGKFGIGFVELADSAGGLALSKGLTTSSFVELIVGGSWRRPEDRTAEQTLGFGIGAHLQLLQAKDVAALTVGGRFQLYLSELCETDSILCAKRGVVSELTPQYTAEIPLRIYWFANQHISVHAELGISFSWGSAGANENSHLVDGVQLSIFEGHSRFGNLGLTLWI